MRLASSFITFFIIVSFAYFASAGKSPKLDNFVKWTKDQGAQIEKLSFAEFVDTGLGLKANEDINENDVIAEIPVSTFFSLKGAEEANLSAPFLDLRRNIAASDQLLLGLYLLHEDALPSSKWRTWLDTLPREFHTPLYFDESEMKELEGTFLYGLAEDRKKSLDESYDAVYKILNEKYADQFPESSRPTRSHFLWAMSCVWSRSVTLKSGQDNIVVLIPFLDFANHASVKTSFRVDEERGVFVVSSGTPFKKGQQVFVDAGNYNNIILLLNRGYVFDEPAYRAAIVTLQLAQEQDAFTALKLKILSENGLPANTSFLLQEGALPQALLRTLRVYNLRNTDIGLYKEALDGRPISIDNELATFRAIVGSIRKLLARFPTSVEDDDALLRTKLSEHTRLAVVLRRSEKMTLESISKMLEQEWNSYLTRGL